MTLPRTDTSVTYPAGDVTATATVLHVEVRQDGRHAVLLDTTAFHPVDPAWPDQGPDRGTLTGPSGTWPVVDCVVGATDGTTLYVGEEVPVRKGTEGWVFAVVHLLDGDGPAEGGTVTARVDADHRAGLSAGHTACHLASLALDRALAGLWRKDVAPDALGAPNFDALAIETSVIGEYGSVDTYRLGRSLRRKGFAVAELSVADAADAVARILSAWTATGAPIRIDVEGPGLTDRRRWVCVLPEATASIPCGGTHLTSLAGLQVEVDLTEDEVDGTPILRMHTRVRTGVEGR